MLEEQIEQWRSYLRNRRAIHTVDIAELEDHLREQIGALSAAGLAPDEAFLVAVKRLGNPRRPSPGVPPRARGPRGEAAGGPARRPGGAPGRGAPRRPRGLRSRGGGG